MGVVYKAEDTKLERTVAIKFLPRQIAVNSEGRERFKIEAKAAASLNHPNIATIYAIEENDDDTFIVMEYIEGRELKELTSDNRQLPISDVTDYATQIADGLKAAHKKGVTHRDIKSSNIKITDEDQVKIMDFGLAKVRGGAQVTKVGTTLGTAAYMSPEQTQGVAVDHRTDIWSLGVVLYEMLTGRLPFAGDYEQAVFYAILNEEPAPVADLREDAPKGLVQIIDKTLRKDVTNRYQSINGIITDLGALQLSRSGAQSRPHPIRKGRRVVSFWALTVLLAFAGFIAYLQYFSTSPKKADFTIAIAPFWGQNDAAVDEGRTMQAYVERKVRELLGHEEDVIVLGKEIGSVPRTHDEARTLGEQVKAALVIWGEVVVLHGEVEIQPYLTVLEQGAGLGVESPQTFHALLSEPNQLSLRKAEAAEIGNLALIVAARYYRWKNPDKALTILQGITPQSIESLSLGAWIYYEKREWQKAEEQFQEVISVDPEGVSYHVHIGLGEVYRWQHKYAEATQQLMRAKALAPDNWAPCYWLGLLFYEQGLYDNALEEYRLASERDPKNAAPHSGLAQAYGDLGRFDEAVSEYQQAMELDPKNEDRYRSNLASIYAKQNEIDRAITEYKKASKINPQNEQTHLDLAELYQKDSRYGDALREYKTAIKLAPNKTWLYRNLARFYMQQGDTVGARQTMHALVELKPDDPSPSFELAEIYHILGEFSNAILEYHKAIELKPNDTWQDAMAYVNLGVLYALRNQHKEALESYATAVQLAPQEHWTHRHLGHFYLRQGEYEKARQELTMSAELDPKSVETQVLLDSVSILITQK